jgi:predicted metalloendopeptidase
MRSILVLLLASCGPKAAPVATPATPVTPPAPAPLPAWAVDVRGSMDMAVDPCSDFYQYACGAWAKNTPLPADKPSYSRSFNTILDRNLSTLRSTLDAAAAAQGSADPVQQKLGAFYGSCLDTASADAAGLAPIQPVLDRIAQVKDAAGFMRASGELRAIGVAGPVRGEIDADFKEPGVQILYLVQSGLSLPDRAYYLKEDDNSKAQRAALESTIATQLGRAGIADAAKRAAEVVAFETALATASVPREDLHDPAKLYLPANRAGVAKQSPGLHWDAWFDGAGLSKADRFSIGTPSAFAGFQAVLKATKPETLRAYLAWQAVHAFAGALDGATFDADFALYGRVLKGQQQPEDRWKRCVRATDGAMGELVGQAFVASSFAGDSKQVALEMIAGIEQAFHDGLGQLSWMDDATRAAADGKVKAILNKIGYPDRWRDYAALEVKPGAWAQNLMNARRFETARQDARIGQPTDRGEWYMSPPTVNAYYNPTVNEIVFPAGILQAPFFARDYPAALNYGGIGMVMGHEVTHGFDDSGSQFDAQGRMVAWWAPDVSKRFAERTACVKNQYDAFEVQPGLKVNGTLTLGENIADIGGTRLAYRAFKAAQAKGAAAAGLPGMTDDQLFFVAMAQTWCSVQSDAYEKMRVLSDPHSPNRFRVNGTLQNLPEFQSAFSCAAGTPMHPASACEVW